MLDMTMRFSAINDSGHLFHSTSSPRRDELLKTEERLPYREPLAALGQAASFLSHEGRNELHNLRLALTLLPHSLDNRDMANELIVQMSERVDHLRCLFDGVREFTTSVTVQPVPCDLKQIWRNAWRSLQSKWQARDVVFQEETGEFDTTLPVDAFRMEQVFRNLFENSLEACDDPVVIGVHCQACDGVLEVSIRDNGPGVEFSQREEIFEIFHTTKAQGSGCGLAIVRQIVEAHGGTISLGQNAFRGAEFVITFPQNDG